MDVVVAGVEPGNCDGTAPDVKDPDEGAGVEIGVEMFGADPMVEQLCEGMLRVKPG